MMCHYPDGTSDWPCHVGNCFNQSEVRNHTDLGSDVSSVWNFCACFSGVISQGNQWWRRKCRLFAQAVVSYAAILVSSRNVIVFLPKEREGGLRDETKTALWD